MMPGVDHAIFVGLSIGGFAAIRAALLYPDRVRALALADTGAGSQGIVIRVKITVLSPVWRTPARRLIVSQVVDVLFGSTARRDRPELVATWRDRFLAQNPASMMTVGLALVQRDGVTDRLTEIRVPPLVIVGDQDVDPGLAASVALAARIPGAEFVALPDTGHLSALENPDSFATALIHFAAALPPPAN